MTEKGPGFHFHTVKPETYFFMGSFFPADAAYFIRS